jgi:hypothetical protein
MKRLKNRSWIVLLCSSIAGQAQPAETNAINEAPPQWTTTGAIYDSQGVPVPGADVVVWRSADPFKHFTTAGSLRGLASLLSTNREQPALSGRFAAEGGDTNVLVILQPAPRR